MGLPWCFKNMDMCAACAGQVLEQNDYLHFNGFVNLSLEAIRVFDKRSSCRKLPVDRL